MDNQIKLTAIIDNSQIDRQISDLQRKIKSLRETGPGGSFSQLAQQYRSQGDEQKAQQIEQFRNRQNAILRTQTQNDIKQQENSLQRLMRHYENIQKGLNNLSTGTDRYNKKLEESAKIWQQIQSTSSSVTSAQKTLGTGLPPGGAPPGAGGGIGGGFGGGAGGGIGGGFGGGAGGAGNILGMLLNPKVLGALGSAAGFGGQFYKQIATYPERLAKSEAQIAGMTSETGRLQMQGKGYEMALFGPERAKALERANTRVGVEKASDITELLGITAAGAGVGAKVAAPYALAASANPFGGPIIGAGIEALGMGIGAGASFTGAMFNDRYRNMIFDRDSYQKQMGAVFSETYQDQLAAERARSYKKDMAAQFFGGQEDRFRSLQKKFGLTGEQLYQGDQSIFGRATSKEGGRYTIENISDAIMGISRAGGTTGVATSGALEAAKLQRNLGITNAPELIGRISGGTGMNAIQSKDEIIRMYAEGTRIGLDSSEVKEYMQAAADYSYKTGSNLETTSGMMSAGIEGSGLKGTRGIEAAQNAMERMRQEGSERGGLTGQYKLAALSSRGFSLKESAYISGLSIDQIDSDPIAQQILKNHPGTTAADLKKDMSRSTMLRQEQIDASEELTNAKNELDKLKPGTKEYEDAQERVKKARANLGMELSVQSKLPSDEASRGAYIDMKAAEATGDTERYKKSQKEYQEAMKKAGIESKETVDLSQKSQAADQKSMLDNLTNNIQSLNDAFSYNEGLSTQAKAAADGLAHLATILQKIKDEDIRKEVQEKIENMTTTSNNNQVINVTTDPLGRVP